MIAQTGNDIGLGRGARVIHALPDQDGLEDAFGATRRALRHMTQLAGGPAAVAASVLPAALESVIVSLAGYHTIAQRALDEALRGQKHEAILTGHFQASAMRQAMALANLYETIVHTPDWPQVVRAVLTAAIVLSADLDGFARDFHRVVSA